MHSEDAQACPVCGMQVEAAAYATEYHGMFYHFCSQQCRDTFASHPGLYSVKGGKAHTEVSKHRRLRLAQACDAATAQTVTAQLQALMGVKEVRIEGGWLTLHYDLLQVTLAQVEAALQKAAVRLHDGWWQGLKRAWLRNTEATELDNLTAAPGACCNRPPPRG
jgi:YHS domain-containing protein